MIGRINKITSPQTDKIYIGSIFRSLKDRFALHKQLFKGRKNGLSHYTSSIEIVCYDDALIEFIGEIEYIDRHELHVKERYYIESNNNKVTKIIPTRTQKEYQLFHIDIFNMYAKDY